MAKKTKKGMSPLSVRELQTWLDGYCEAHGANWAPTPEQWEKIKEKIFALDDDTQVQSKGNNYSVTTGPANYVLPQREFTLPPQQFTPMPQMPAPAFGEVNDDSTISPFA